MCQDQLVTIIAGGYCETRRVDPGGLYSYRPWFFGDEEGDDKFGPYLLRVRLMKDVLVVPSLDLRPGGPDFFLPWSHVRRFPHGLEGDPHLSFLPVLEIAVPQTG